MRTPWVAAISSCALLLGCHGSVEPAPAGLAPTVEPAPEPVAKAEDPLPRSFDSLELTSAGSGCWIRDDGRLVCWGEDGSIGGALPGLAFGRQRVVPGIYDVVQIDDGCAVTRAGEVHCFNELSRVWRHAPPSTSREIWMSSTMDDESSYFGPPRPDISYVVDAEGRLAWYMDEHAEGFRRNTWELVEGIEGVVELAEGGIVCVRTEAGTLHCLDRGSPPEHVAAIDIAGPVRLQPSLGVLVHDERGAVHQVTLKDGSWEVESTGVGDVVELVLSCALRVGGLVTCGLGDKPWQLNAPPARVLVAKRGMVCVLAESNGAVHCTDKTRGKPRRIAKLSPARALTNVDWPSEWAPRPCVIHESGEVRCMGKRFGDLVTTGLRGDAIAAAGQTLCASENGQVSCWESHTPDKIFRLPIDDAVGFEPFAKLLCIRRADDSRLCVGGGYDDYAVLREGPIRGIGPATEVAVIGSVGACVLERSGSVRCWGDDTDAEAGQLGDGRLQASLRPVTVVGIDDVIDIDADASSACAARSNGRVACWGYAPFGKRTIHATPVEVPGFEDVAQVSVGSESLCARHHDGGVSCAGFRDEFPTPTRIEGVESAVHLVSEPMGLVCALTGDVASREVVCWGLLLGHFRVYRNEAELGARGFAHDYRKGRCFDIPDPRGPKCLGIEGDLHYMPWPDPLPDAVNPNDHTEEHDRDRSKEVQPDDVSYPFEDPWEG